MGWVIFKHIFSTNTAILNVRRLSTLEKVLETLVLRQQLTILKLKRKTCRFDRLIPPSHNPNALAFRRTHKIKSLPFQQVKIFLAPQVRLERTTVGLEVGQFVVHMVLWRP